MVKVEVLCESIQDCIVAQEAGADRIELNNGVLLGGLTPSLGTLIVAKQYVTIPVVTMVRPRTAGFYYDEESYQQMLIDGMLLLEHGADGLVFGFLNEDRSIDVKRTKEFVGLCRKYDKETIFHRAFDHVIDPIESIETLIECGIDRVLTSGLEATALEGASVLKELIATYGDKIEILPGSGIDSHNVKEVVAKTGATQVHGSFKEWVIDPTSTRYNEPQTEAMDYYQVSYSKLMNVIELLSK